MSATDFLPRREADLRDWSVNFNSHINADPATYGLTAAQAADYNTKHNAFMAVFALASAPGTRTRPRVVEKNAAQQVLRRSARQLAAIIRAFPGVTAVQRVEAGLTVRGSGGRSAPIPPPRTAPRLMVLDQRGGRVTIGLGNMAEASRRGRPRGVRGAVVLFFVGELPPADRADWSWLDMTSKTKLTLNLPRGLAPGTPIWLTAFWENPRSQRGPLATPIYTHAPWRLMARARLPEVHSVNAPALAQAA
jgi:hypothetical protein